MTWKCSKLGFISIPQSHKIVFTGLRCFEIGGSETNYLEKCKLSDCGQLSWLLGYWSLMFIIKTSDSCETSYVIKKLSLMHCQPHLWDFILLQTYCLNLKYAAALRNSTCIFFLIQELRFTLVLVLHDLCEKSNITQWESYKSELRCTLKWMMQICLRNATLFWYYSNFFL